MTLNPTPELLTNLYWITLIAVIVSSASAVLKADSKMFDITTAAVTAGVSIFSARLLALYFNVSLPKFHFKT